MDWNIKANKTLRRYCVTSLAEVWIETSVVGISCRIAICHFPCGSVDWNSCCRIAWIVISSSLPLRKCGLKHPQAFWVCMEYCHFPCGSVDWNVHKAFFPAFSIKSLPLRKCGLKQKWQTMFDAYFGHFPCGSVDWNIRGRDILPYCYLSLPLRKCGLKLLLPDRVDRDILVTSLAEVWIETSDADNADSFNDVTSLAEVWIETKITYLRWKSHASLPLRKCGLKRLWE